MNRLRRIVTTMAVAMVCAFPVLGFAVLAIACHPAHDGNVMITYYNDTTP